jgi:hypothetical protein
VVVRAGVTLTAGSFNGSATVTDGTNNVNGAWAVTVDSPANLAPTNFIFTPQSGLVAPVSAGTIVGQFSASDPEGAPLTFGNFTDDSGSLSLDSTTGTVTATIAINSATVANVSATVTDGTNALPSQAGVVTITAPANNPPTGFSFTPVAGLVAPLTAGTVVGNYSATDPEGDLLTYSDFTDSSGLLSIDSNTGAVVTTAAVNTAVSANVSATVTDSVNAPLTAVAGVVTISAPSNNPPTSFIFTAGAPLVAPVPAGTIVGTFSASDPEGGPLTFGDFTDDSGSLTLDTTTGTVSTSIAINSAVVANLSATVTDGVNALPAVGATITISAPANNPPTSFIFTPAGALTAPVAAGTLVGTFSASDPEGAPLTFGDFSDSSGLLALDPSSGAVTAAVAINTATTATISATVSDGVNALPAVGATINIGAPANNPPTGFVFTPVGGLTAPLSAGTVVGTFSASDPETDPLTYSDFTDSSGALAMDGGGNVTVSGSISNAVTINVSATVSDGTTILPPAFGTVTVGAPAAPAGSFIYVDGSGNAFQQNYDGTGNTQLTFGGGVNNPVWSSSTTFVYADSISGDLVSFDTSSGTATPITSDGAAVIEGTPITAAGQTAYTALDGGGVEQIFVVGVGAVTTYTDGSIGGISFSPDGGRILYSRTDGGGATNLYVRNISAGTDTQITFSASNSTPTWSADGSMIAWVSDQDGENDIWVASIDGGNNLSGQLNITGGNSRNEGAPGWSPSSVSPARILFTAGGTSYVINPNGTGEQPVAGGSGNQGWRP